jgi:hypothetical protein
MRSFLMVTAVTLLTAPPVSAEWFFDLYGGGAFVENTDVKLRKNFRFANNLGSADVRLRATLRDVKADDFATAGGRFGYWSEAFPYLGLGVDVFLVDLEVPRQRVRADANATVDVRVRHRTFHIDQGINPPGPASFGVVSNDGRGSGT